MSVEFIGILNSNEGSESRVPPGPGVDTHFIKAFAQTQEYAGFDKVLLAVGTSSADSLILASYAAAVTDKLGFLVAHRPGFQAPTFAARQLATLDQLTGGRTSINVITGGDSGDLQRDGDYLSKDERYERTDEYLDIARKVWTSTEPFSHQGKHYRIEDNLTLVKPVQKPYIPIYFSGASDAAVEVAAKHADVYMMWGEPVANIRERIAQVRKAAAKYGREKHIRFSLSLRPVLAATEEAAWARAEQILQQAKAQTEKRVNLRRAKPIVAAPNVGYERLASFAQKQAVHDKRLWTALTTLPGASGNSTGLVGTAEQVADSLLDYYDAGITTFLIRGFDQLRDAAEYGQDLIPLVKSLIAQKEAAKRVSA